MPAPAAEGAAIGQPDAARRIGRDQHLSRGGGHQRHPVPAGGRCQGREHGTRVDAPLPGAGARRAGGARAGRAPGRERRRSTGSCGSPRSRAARHIAAQLRSAIVPAPPRSTTKVPGTCERSAVTPTAPASSANRSSHPGNWSSASRARANLACAAGGRSVSLVTSPKQLSIAPAADVAAPGRSGGPITAIREPGARRATSTATDRPRTPLPPPRRPRSARSPP